MKPILIISDRTNATILDVFFSDDLHYQNKLNLYREYKENTTTVSTTVGYSFCRHEQELLCSLKYYKDRGWLQ